MADSGEDDEPIEPSRPTTSGNTDQSEQEDSSDERDQNEQEIGGEGHRSDDSSTDSSISLTEEQLHDIEIANTKELEKELDLVINKHSWIFEKLFQEYDFEKCKDISLKCRKRNHFRSSGLAYAEIKYKDYAEIFCQLYKHGLQREGLAGKFVDIGSGVGKAVFATALLHDFKWIMGIEVLEDLVDVSNSLLTSAWMQMVIDGDIEDTDKRQIDIKFVHGDASFISWQDADVVFMNSTCFGEDLRASLSATAEKLRKDSLVITVSYPLESSMFECVIAVRMDVSWGSSTAYIYKKIK